MTRLGRPLLNYYRYRGARFKPLRHPACDISSKPFDFERKDITTCRIMSRKKINIWYFTFFRIFSPIRVVILDDYFSPQLNKDGYTLCTAPSRRPF